MTAQHVPQKPLRRRVISLPQTRLGWWAVGLSGISLVITAFGFIVFTGLKVLVPGVAYDDTGAPVGPLPDLGMLIQVLSGGVGAVVALIAVGRGERSRLLWVSLVPVLLFFILPVIGALLGY
jgi:hypothetical protein